MNKQIEVLVEPYSMNRNSVRHINVDLSDIVAVGVTSRSPFISDPLVRIEIKNRGSETVTLSEFRRIWKKA